MIEAPLISVSLGTTATPPIASRSRAPSSAAASTSAKSRRICPESSCVDRERRALRLIAGRRVPEAGRPTRSPSLPRRLGGGLALGGARRPVRRLAILGRLARRRAIGHLRHFGRTATLGGSSARRTTATAQARLERFHQVDDLRLRRLLDRLD